MSDAAKMKVNQKFDLVSCSGIAVLLEVVIESRLLELFEKLLVDEGFVF